MSWNQRAPGRVAHEAGLVGEHPPDRDGLDHAERARRVAELGQVRDRRVVEMEFAFVAELHDRGRGERLRDRGDAEQRPCVVRPPCLDIRVAVARRPHERVVDDDARRRTGQTLLLDERGDALGQLARGILHRVRARVRHQIPFR